MANLSDLQENLQRMRLAVMDALPDIAAKVALSAKALAERQIKDSGFGEKYSSNKYPAWFLHGKELNARGTKFLEQRGVNSEGGQGAPKKRRRKAKGDPDPGYYDKLTNWSEFRQAQGLQNQHVDLSYSNKMFANMGVVRFEKVGEYKVLALLGGTNVEAQNKMNWNYDRYGDYVRKALNKDSEEILANLALSEIGKIVDQYKLQS